MVNGHISIQYRGFHPSEYTQEHLMAALEELEIWAPVGSLMKAQISRDGGMLKATLQVLSRGTSFFVKASGTGVRDVIERMETQAKKKLAKWKSQKLRKRENFKLSGYDWAKEESYDSNVA